VEVVSAAVLVVIWLLVWLPRLHGPIDLRWDSSVYYVLGTSLAQGDGYRLLNEPGKIEAVQYPPFLPLVVAAHQLVMGTSDYLIVTPRLRLCYFLLSGLYLFAGYVLVRRFLDPPYALFTCTLTAFSFYSFLNPSDALYAEIPFGFVATLFLICQLRRDRRGYGAAAGVLAGAAYLLRTAGLALLVAWVAESLLRRRFRAAAIRVFVAAIPVILWQAHVSRVTGSQDYHVPAYSYQRAAYNYSNITYGENSWLVDPFRPEAGRMHVRDLPARVVRNIAAIPAALGESSWMPASSMGFFHYKLESKLGLVVTPGWRALSSAALAWCLAVIGCLMLVGAVLLALRGEWFLPLYFALSLGLIVLTPWSSQFVRYLAPLAPLSGLFLIQAVQGGTAWLTRRHTRLGMFAAAIPLVIGLLIQAFIARSFLQTLLPVSYYDAAGREQPARLLTYGSDWHALDPAFEWIRRQARPGAVIATSVPHLAYLRSGHMAVLPPMEPDSATASRLLDSVPVEYLVLDVFDLPGITERYAAPVVAAEPERWRLVYGDRAGGVRIYQRVSARNSAELPDPK
jgi:hypothetical protein